MRNIVRNTSTDVEKTLVRPNGQIPAKKHLHGRGEDSITEIVSLNFVGNTSTYVEKTQVLLRKSACHWKHLHGRGEDYKSDVSMKLR